MCASYFVLMAWQGKNTSAWMKKYVHISLIHSQLNPHHYLQPALNIIKGFIFVLQNLSVIMECLCSAAFLCVCLKWGTCHFLHFLLYHLHFLFCPHTISFLLSTIQPAPLRWFIFIKKWRWNCLWSTLTDTEWGVWQNTIFALSSFSFGSLGYFEIKSSNVKLSSEPGENFPKIWCFAVKWLHNC